MMKPQRTVCLVDKKAVRALSVRMPGYGAADLGGSLSWRFVLMSFI
jgi:hypothetical protein